MSAQVPKVDLSTGVADWRLPKQHGKYPVGKAPTTGPHSLWTKPSHPAKWLGSSSSDWPPGDTSFEVSFEVHQPDAARLELLYAVDNSLKGATLNGKAIDIGKSQSFKTLGGASTIRASGAAEFRHGINTLRVTVGNSGKEPNPMGFLCTGSVVIGQAQATSPWPATPHPPPPHWRPTSVATPQQQFWRAVLFEPTERLLVSCGASGGDRWRVAVWDEKWSQPLVSEATGTQLALHLAHIAHSRLGLLFCACMYGDGGWTGWQPVPCVADGVDDHLPGHHPTPTGQGPLVRSPERRAYSYAAAGISGAPPLGAGGVVALDASAGSPTRLSHPGSGHVGGTPWTDASLRGLVPNGRGLWAYAHDRDGTLLAYPTTHAGAAAAEHAATLPSYAQHQPTSGVLTNAMSKAGLGLTTLGGVSKGASQAAAAAHAAVELVCKERAGLEATQAHLRGRLAERELALAKAEEVIAHQRGEIAQLKTAVAVAEGKADAADLAAQQLAGALATASGEAELKQLFQSLDKNGDGKLTSKEWGAGVGKHAAMMQKYFGGRTTAEIGRAFAKIDVDGSDSLTWDELVAFARNFRLRMMGGVSGALSSAHNTMHHSSCVTAAPTAASSKPSSAKAGTARPASAKSNADRPISYGGGYAPAPAPAARSYSPRGGGGGDVPLSYGGGYAPAPAPAPATGDVPLSYGGGYQGGGGYQPPRRDPNADQPVQYYG